MNLSIRPGHAVLDAAPLLARIIAAIKPARGGNVITIFAARIILDVVHVDVIDARAAILPALATVAAEQVAAMFEQYPDEILIVGMDEDMAHMREFHPAQAWRHVPFAFHIGTEVEHAVERLPGFAVVLTAE